MMIATISSNPHSQRAFPPPVIGGRAWREGVFLGSFSHAAWASGSGGKSGFDIMLYGLCTRAVIALEPTA